MNTEAAQHQRIPYGAAMILDLRFTPEKMKKMQARTLEVLYLSQENDKEPFLHVGRIRYRIGRDYRKLYEDKQFREESIEALVDGCYLKLEGRCVSLAREGEELYLDTKRTRLWMFAPSDSPTKDIEVRLAELRTALGETN